MELDSMLVPAIKSNCGQLESSHSEFNILNIYLYFLDIVHTLSKLMLPP